MPAIGLFLLTISEKLENCVKIYKKTKKKIRHIITNPTSICFFKYNNKQRKTDMTIANCVSARV